MNRNKISKLILYYLKNQYQLIYIDETHINSQMKPKKGLFKKNEKAKYKKIINNVTDGVTLLSAISNKKIISFQFF